MDPERMPPTKDMLPAFLVMSGRQPGGDGVIRMKKAEYDSLLAREPRAALRYVDESDGEVILVGSSLELDQRLQEPVERASRITAGVNIDLYGAGQTPMHSFDIEKQERVMTEWSALDKRTTEEGQKAKDLFFGKNKSNIKPAGASRSSKSHNDPFHCVDHKPAKKDVHFGQPSPPRSSLSTSKSQGASPADHHRWASYSTLPAAFDKASSSVSLPQVTQPPPAAIPIPKSAFNVMLDAAADPTIRSSTVQVPSTRKQSKEHQPLLEMFWKQQPLARQLPKVAGNEEEFHPLLDLYEKQLHQLGNTSASPTIAPDEESTGQAGSRQALASMPQAPEAMDLPDSKPAANYDAPTHLQTPGELLTMSIRSLLNGVGQLASAFKLTNSELEQQIAVAQRDFPNNIEKAIKSSMVAVDSLRNAIPHHKSPTSISQTDSGTQSSKPAMADRATSASSGAEDEAAQLANFQQKRTTAPSTVQEVTPKALVACSELQDAEQEEILRQSYRVEQAVEAMRIALLDMGWKKTPTSDNRVYTRADILEEFLACFKNTRKLQQIPAMVHTAQPYERADAISPLSWHGETQAVAGPSIPMKIKDDDLPALERPYSWDLDYCNSANSAWHKRQKHSGNEPAPAAKESNTISEADLKQYVNEPYTCSDCWLSFPTVEQSSLHRQSGCPRKKKSSPVTLAPWIDPAEDFEGDEYLYAPAPKPSNAINLDLVAPLIESTGPMAGYRDLYRPAWKSSSQRCAAAWTGHTSPIEERENLHAPLSELSTDRPRVAPVTGPIGSLEDDEVLGKSFSKSAFKPSYSAASLDPMVDLPSRSGHRVERSDLEQAVSFANQVHEIPKRVPRDHAALWLPLKKSTKESAVKASVPKDHENEESSSSIPWKPLKPQKASQAPHSLYQMYKSEQDEYSVDSTRWSTDLLHDHALEKYPTISQLEQGRSCWSEGHSDANQTRSHSIARDSVPGRHINTRAGPALRHMESISIQPGSTISQTDYSAPYSTIADTRKRLEKRYTSGLGPKGLAAQQSMPILTAARPHRASHRGDTATLFEGFPTQTSRPRDNPLPKAASTNFDHSQHGLPRSTAPGVMTATTHHAVRAGLPEGSQGVRRANTVAGSGAQHQVVRGETRPPAYKPYEPAKYRPVSQDAAAQASASTPAPPPHSNTHKIEDCKHKLLEMGFGDVKASDVSQLVSGDLEEAITMLEEDDEVRKAWGKGREQRREQRRTERERERRHMPGAFDDEIYG